MGEISFRDKNIWFSLSLVVKLCILRWALMGINVVLDLASSVHSRNCSFWHLRFGFFSALGHIDWKSLSVKGCTLHSQTSQYIDITLFLLFSSAQEVIHQEIQTRVRY